MLGDNATAFLMSVLNCVQNNDKLAECEPQSILMASAVAGTLGLPIDPNLGQAYIIPYNIKIKGKDGLPDTYIKKAQFLAPEQMAFAVEKVESTGNRDILLTERGSIFGYRDLLVDFRSIPDMKKMGYPVIFDGTHSQQIPNSSSGVTGGIPEHIEPMCKAAIAVGADGLFLETHPRPSEALSDGANMLPLDKLEPLLIKLKRIHSAL